MARHHETGTIADAASLRVYWYKSWSAHLDRALDTIPEDERCPHELFRRLMHSANGQKRAALVTAHGDPVAVIGLRQRGWHYEPVGSDAVTPRFVAPARPGFLFPALRALGIDLWIRTQPTLPPPGTAQEITPFPIYRMECRADFERYWHESGLWKNIKAFRKRSAGMTFVVDAPGGIRWTIERWRERWLDDSQRQVDSAGDQIIAGEYFQALGMYHSFLLLDGAAPVAGCNFYVDRHDLLFLTTTYLPEYAWHGVSTRLLDLIFGWAASSSYQRLDLGGGHEYKRRWAPLDGARWSYNICPAPLAFAKRTRRRLVAAVRRMTVVRSRASVIAD